MRLDATMGESAMLTKQQRRSLTRALTKTYYKYRGLSLLRVCRELQICLYENEGGGSVAPARASEKYQWNLGLPGKMSPDYREHTFWHEIGHTVLAQFQSFPDGIFWPTFLGYNGYLQQFDEEWWVQERLCEAFADLMFLYRRGLLVPHPRGIGRFLFADTSSIGYAELNRFSSERIGWYCEQASKTGRNLDLRGIEKMLEENRRTIYKMAFQLELPIDFPLHLSPEY
jgi:hypothetical protein